MLKQIEEEEESLATLFGMKPESTEVKETKKRREVDPQEAIARKLRTVWRKAKWAECREMLDTIEPPTNPKVLNIIEGLLFGNQAEEAERLSLEERETLLQLRMRLLDILNTSPKPKALYLLIDMLSLLNITLADRAQHLLQQKGNKALPALLKRIQNDPRTRVFHIWLSQIGLYRVLRLLGESSDHRAIQALFDTFEGTRQRSSKSKNFTAFLLASLFLGKLLEASWSTVALIFGIAFLPVYFALRAMDRTGLKNTRPLQLCALEGIAKHPTKSHLLSLLSILENKSLIGTDEAQRALFVYLKILEPEDALFIPPDARRWLIRQVSKVSLELGSEILTVLGWVGSSEILPLLQRLTKRPSPLQFRAMEILPLVERRSAGENSPHQLLRASHAPDHAETLLRPAKESRDPAEVAHLLRPHIENPSLHTEQEGVENTE